MLRARSDQPEPLAAIERYIDAHFKHIVERSVRDERQLLMRLHPAAEDIEFTLEGGVVLASAKTSTVGPGYHAFVCDVLRELEDHLRLEWTAEGDEGDETGYFESDDRDALEAEMLSWLQGLCNLLAERIAEGATGFLISLPTDNVFDFDEAIATPMGPRDLAWIEAVRKDPRKGIDVFPWWEPGMGAEYARGRALTRMWTEVRWREPVNEAEQDLLEDIDADLSEASDSSLDLPWAEWAEIARLLEQDDPTSGRAEGLRPTIGYRRRPVRTSLPGGWTIRIPGEMSTEVDEQGTFSAYTPGRTIWMSSFRIGNPETPTLTAAQTLPRRTPDGQPIELPELAADHAYRASIGTTSEGDPRLTLEIALPHRIAVFTFVLDDEEDLDWAKSVAATARGI